MTAGLSAGSALDALQSASAAPRLLRASKTFTGAANLGATGVNELFTTTGTVFVAGFWIRCTTDMVDAVDGALFTLGQTGLPAIWGDFTGAFDLDTLNAGDGLTFNSVLPGMAYNLVQPPTTFAETGNPAVFANIIMTISTQAITGGVLQFYILYTPLSSNGALALGAGMVAI